MKLRPLEFKASDKFNTLGEAFAGTYFRFKGQKTVYMIKQNDGLFVTISKAVKHSQQINLNAAYKNSYQAERERERSRSCCH